MKESQHIALYRKYRPHTFADVVGQDHVVELLQKAVRDNRPNHACLFCGGRGTGKTSVARIFAREVGCNPEDIIEIDAASNRGIDEIRELREAIRTHPFSSKYKIYIIDEAHMLTKEAANALLKTLEEPPSHVLFILATTDPEKLPVTIVSRCQKIIFSTPSLQTLATRLIYVAEQEGKQLTESGALVIAKHGKGSYRDALGYLEQSITTSKAALIDDVHISSVLGYPEKELLLELVTAFASKDIVQVSKVISLLEKKGNALRLYDDFLEVLRKALLSRIGNKEEDEAIISIGKTYATVINSNLLVSLLEKRHLITVSDAHGFLALEAILLSEISATK